MSWTHLQFLEFEFDEDTYRASIYRVVEESRHASRIRWQAQF